MEKKHVLQTLNHINQHKRDKFINLKYADRQFPHPPQISHPQTTRPSGAWDSMYEDGAAPASGMAVGAGDPGKTTNPSENHAMQKYRLQSKILRRKKPVEEAKMAGHAAEKDDRGHEDYEATLAHAVKQAKGIAFDKRYAAGDMTGAHNAISKLGKKYGIHGLERHPEVKSALSRSNMEEEVEQVDEISMSKVLDYATRLGVKNRKSGKPYKLALGKLQQSRKYPAKVPASMGEEAEQTDESMIQLTRALSGREYGKLPPEKVRKEKSPLRDRIRQALKLSTASKLKVAEEAEQIDELHSNTLARYSAKAHSEIQNRKYGYDYKDAPGNKKKIAKREAGGNIARKILTKRKDAANKEYQERLKNPPKRPVSTRSTIGDDYRTGKYQGD